MGSSFEAQVELQECDDPDLEALLGECRIHASVSIDYWTDIDDVRLDEVDIKSLEFEPPDGPEALKAKIFMNETLKETIRKSLEAKVMREWEATYGGMAMKHEEHLKEAAAEASAERSYRYF